MTDPKPEQDEVSTLVKSAKKWGDAATSQSYWFGVFASGLIVMVNALFFTPETAKMELFNQGVVFIIVGTIAVAIYSHIKGKAAAAMKALLDADEEK